MPDPLRRPTGSPSRPPDPDTETDAVLLARAGFGDLDAYVVLYRRHRAGARWVAERWTGPGDDADDVVAEAFARLLAALPRLDPRAVPFRRYLFACIRNAAHDRARRDSRVELRADVPERADGVEWPEVRSAVCRHEVLEDALEALPTRWRRILWLTAVDGLAVSEVAEAAGCSPGTVSAVAYRARRRLRHTLQATHPTIPTDPACPLCRRLPA